jgi:hypothetical protein
MPWLRVVELTKKGQAHLHILFGNVEHRVRCWTKDEYKLMGKRAWGTWFRSKERWETCDCLTHRMSRHWYALTGDSWVVFGEPVTGAETAGKYLSKYMAKDMPHSRDYGQMMDILGFSRRWSCSQDWPRDEKIQTLLTKSGNPPKTTWYPYNNQLAQRVRQSEASGEGDWILRRGGGRMWQDIADRNKRNYQMAKLRRLGIDSGNQSKNGHQIGDSRKRPGANRHNYPGG